MAFLPFYSLGSIYIITPELNAIQIGQDASDNLESDYIYVESKKLISGNGLNFSTTDNTDFTITNGSELIIKDGYKIKFVEYPDNTSNGGTLYRPDTFFELQSIINKKLYISLEYEETSPIYSFKHRYRNTFLIGTGTYKFRPYTVVEPIVTGDFLTTSSDKILQDSNGNNIEFTEEEPVTLISFTIAGASYQAKEGMTWEEWVNSDYNPGRYSLDGNYYVYIPGGNRSEYLQYENANVSGKTIILANTSYTLLTVSGGIGN